MHLMFGRVILCTGKVQALVQMADASTATAALTVGYNVQPPSMQICVCAQAINHGVCLPTVTGTTRSEHLQWMLYVASRLLQPERVDSALQ